MIGFGIIRCQNEDCLIGTVPQGLLVQRGVGGNFEVRIDHLRTGVLEMKD